VEGCHELVVGGVESIQQIQRCLCAEEFFTLFAVLSTCFYWIEGAWAEAVVVTVSFCSSFEQIVKKLNFVV
jgi:hypothetical protein